MEVTCTQCGAAVKIPEGELFVQCSYCNSALYLDKSRIVFHYLIEPTLKPDEALQNLKRWMAGNQTPKGLDEEAEVTKNELFFFPLWRFVTQAAKPESESVLVQPAAPTVVAEIREISLPAGKLKFYTEEAAKGQNFIAPTILLSSAIEWLKSSEISSGDLKETSLVHIPVYHFFYLYKGVQYSAVADASTGKVVANVFPAKSETPFLATGIIAALLFFIEGLLIPGLPVKLLVYALSSIPLLAVASLIARNY